MKYVLILPLFFMNNVFADGSNSQEKLKVFLEENQAQIQQEIQREKDDNKEAIERLQKNSKGLDAAGRIVAAFNQKNNSDVEATRLAQEIFAKLQQVIHSDSWQKLVNRIILSPAENMRAQMAIINQVDHFCKEQAAKSPDKETENDARKAVIFMILSKFATQQSI